MARLQQQLGTAQNLLAMAGLLNKALDSWVRLELVEELPPEDRTGDDELTVMAREWRERKGSAGESLPEPLLRRKLEVGPCSRRWARRQWGHRLQTLFLERKDELDQASCRLLRVRDKHLCHELYHRIKAQEASFMEVAGQFGEGPERKQLGLIPLQPMTRLPMGLGPVLRRLKEGELTPPQRVGEMFAVVLLESFVPAKLDARSEELLLATELSNWTAAVVAHLGTQLRSMPHPSDPGP